MNSERGVVVSGRLIEVVITSPIVLIGFLLLGVRVITVRVITVRVITVRVVTMRVDMNLSVFGSKLGFYSLQKIRGGGGKVENEPLSLARTEPEHELERSRQPADSQPSELHGSVLSRSCS